MGASDWTWNMGGVMENREYWTYLSTTSGYPNSQPEYGQYKTDMYYRFRNRSGSKSPVTSRAGIYPWRNPTAYERWVCQFRHTAGVWSGFYPGGWGYWQTRTGYYSIASTLDTTFGDYGRRTCSDELMNRTRVECLLKLYDSKASLGANLAEAVSAADNLGRSATNVLSVLRAAKHGNWGLVMRKLAPSESISSNYLKLHFGLMPLLQDAKGTYDVLSGKVKLPMILTARKRNTAHKDFDDLWDKWGNIREARDKFTEKALVSVTAKIEDPGLVQASSLGLTDPLAMAWEIVPWSFVFDWFMPVGNMLEALNATKGLSFVGGSETSFVDGHYSGIRNGGINEQSPQRVEADYFCHRRSLLNGFPIVRPYAKSPFSTSHVVTALALWRQLFK